MSDPRNGQVPLHSSIEASSSTASITHRQAVPGDSPSVYVGDPSNDLLSIDALDLLPNPPIDHMTLRLRGCLKSDIGAKARVKVIVSLNGTVGPGFEDDLCDEPKIEVTQNGTRVRSLSSGPVEMSYRVVIPYTWLKKGNYTVRTEMYANDGSRMTGFEGTVWVNGEADDDGSGWAREG